MDFCIELSAAWNPEEFQGYGLPRAGSPPVLANLLIFSFYLTALLSNYPSNLLLMSPVRHIVCK